MLSVLPCHKQLSSKHQLKGKVLVKISFMISGFWSEQVYRQHIGELGKPVSILIGMNHEGKMKKSIQIYYGGTFKICFLPWFFLRVVCDEYSMLIIPYIFLIIQYCFKMNCLGLGGNLRRISGRSSMQEFTSSTFSSTHHYSTQSARIFSPISMDYHWEFYLTVLRC